MAELFTVRMKRKVKTHKYDAKGKLVGQSEHFIEECYHSLPARTAEMYREKFPDAFVEILPTAEARRGTGAYGDRRPRAHESTGAGDATTFYHNTHKRTAEQSAKAGRKGAAAAARKAREATYADALNAAVGSAA